MYLRDGGGQVECISETEVTGGMYLRDGGGQVECISETEVDRRNVPQRRRWTGGMYLRDGGGQAECISETDLLNCTYCHTGAEIADPTSCLIQYQYTDTGQTSPSADSLTPNAWRGSHRCTNVLVTGVTRPGKTGERYPASGFRCGNDARETDRGGGGGGGGRGGACGGGGR